MAKAKGTKMSLAAFNQQEGDDGYDPLPTAPRQRDPAAVGSNNGGDDRDRRQKVDGGNWVRGDKFQSSEDGEQRGGGGRGRGGGYGRNRGDDDNNSKGGDRDREASSRADDANQWRSGGRGGAGGDDRDRRSGGGFGGRDRDRRDDRDGDSDTPRRSGGYGRGRDEETKPSSEAASSSNDWRRSGPPSDDRDRFSGSNHRRFEDRDSRYGGGRDRDRRDDRDDRFNRRGGDESNDRFRREDRGGDREDRFGGRRDDRFGGDRDNRRGGDDRYGGDRERDGGRYGDRRYGGDRDSRYGGRGGDSDDRPAHLRFGRSRNDGGAEGKSDLSAVDDFPLPSSSAANRTEASEKAAAGPKITVKTAKKPVASSEEGEKTEGKAESESSVSKKKSNKKIITPLEAALKGGVISDSQFTASMDWLVEEKARLDDAEERRELVYAIAGSLMDKKLSLSTVITALEKSLPDNASTFVLDLIKAIRTRKDESVALALVKGADQTKVLSLISNDKQGSALESFLNDNELSILIPVPDLSESVEKALQNKESADAILKIIDNAVDKKAAVSYLLPLVSKYLIALLFADKPKHNISVLTAWAPLLSRITLHDKLAKVSLLFSICNAWFTETKAAKGVIRELFETLLNNKVIQVESLIDWRDSKEKSPSKPKALLQVSTWINDIEPKREEPEEEEGEEGDDDELLTNPNQQD